MIPVLGSLISSTKKLEASNTKSFSTVNVCSAIMCRVGNSEPLSLYSSERSEISSSGQSHPMVKSKSTKIQGIPDSFVVCNIEELVARLMKSDWLANRSVIP